MVAMMIRGDTAFIDAGLLSWLGLSHPLLDFCDNDVLVLVVVNLNDLPPDRRLLRWSGNLVMIHVAPVIL